MPELPDLLRIRKYLQDNIVSRTIVDVQLKQPVVLRVALDQRFDDLLIGKTVERIDLRGPFIRFDLSDSIDVIANLMLMGKLQHQRGGEKPEGFLCLSLGFDNGTRLNVCDEQKMVKVYIVLHGKYDIIPKFNQQGIDILTPEFTPDVFSSLAKKHSRKQVRVFINDHTILSAIGNAYADEILFEAGIHPKTFVSKLSPLEIAGLYKAIHAVMRWGTQKVEEASQPIQIKVRGHMNVRWRKDEPCPRCGTTIRREGVRGHDVFFCPHCQPTSRKLFIDWKKT